MSIKQWIRNWLNDDGGLLKGARVMEVDSSPSDQTGISISNAINGKVLTLRTYQPKNNRSDWLTELYIVPEGESLTEAITILLLAKGLK